MIGRDPHEREPRRDAARAALRPDLRDRVRHGRADELAHLLAEDHVGDGIVGFGFATFAVSGRGSTSRGSPRRTTPTTGSTGSPRWCRWSACSSSRSACRPCSSRWSHGEHVDNRVMVLGYVVMRVPMLVQWLARRPPGPGARPRSCRAMIVTLLVAQVGWIAARAARHLDPGVPRRAPLVLVIDRDRRPARRRAPARRHALARPPHRRALRPDGHHRPRRGPARHDRRARRAASTTGWTVDVAVLGLAGVGADLRRLVDLLRDPAAARPPARPPAPRLRLGLRPHPALRRGRRGRCRAARRGVPPRGRLRALRHRHGADRRDPARAVRRADLPAVRAAQPPLDPFHLLLVGLSALVLATGTAMSAAGAR